MKNNFQLCAMLCTGSLDIIYQIYISIKKKRDSIEKNFPSTQTHKDDIFRLKSNIILMYMSCCCSILIFHYVNAKTNNVNRVNNL